MKGTQLQIKLLTYFRIFGPFLLKVFLGLIKKVLNWKTKRLKTYMFGMAPSLFKFTFTFFKELLDCMKVNIKVRKDHLIYNREREREIHRPSDLHQVLSNIFWETEDSLLLLSAIVRGRAPVWACQHHYCWSYHSITHIISQTTNPIIATPVTWDMARSLSDTESLVYVLVYHVDVVAER